MTQRNGTRRIGKRALSLLLALLLALSLLPVGALAAGEAVAPGDAFTVDGISYTVNSDKKAVVTGGSFTDGMSIPAVVSYKKLDTACYGSGVTAPTDAKSLSAVVGGIDLNGGGALRGLTSLTVQVATTGYSIPAGTFVSENGSSSPTKTGPEITVVAISPDKSAVRGFSTADGLSGGTGDNMQKTYKVDVASVREAPALTYAHTSAAVTISPNFITSGFESGDFVNDTALLYKFTSATELQVVQALNPASASLSVPASVEVNGAASPIAVTSIAAGAFSASPANAAISLSVRNEGLTIGANAFTSGQTVNISPASKGFFNTWGADVASLTSASTTLTTKTGAVTLTPAFYTFGVGVTFSDGTYVYSVTKAEAPFEVAVTGFAPAESIPTSVKLSTKVSDATDGTERSYAVTSIAANAFEDKTGVTSVNIPKSVTSIGANAFAGCEITEGRVTVGSAPTGSPDSFDATLTVGSGAFDDFTKITVKAATVSGFTYAMTGTLAEGSITVTYTAKTNDGSDALDTDREFVGEYKEVYVGNARFINGGETAGWVDKDSDYNGDYMEDNGDYSYGMQRYAKTISNNGYNMFENFGVFTSGDSGRVWKVNPANDDGFFVTSGNDWNYNSVEISGDGFYSDDDDEAVFTVRFTSEYPQLYAFAQSAGAQIFFGTHLSGNKNEHCGGTDYDRAYITVALTGESTQSLNTSNDIRDRDFSTGWMDVDPGDVLTITARVEGDAADVGAEIFDTLLLFRDATSPELEDYEMDTNGDVFMNSSVSGGTNEVLLGLEDDSEGKPNGEINMTVSFSDPVTSMLSGVEKVNGEDFNYNSDGTSKNTISDDAKMLDLLANHVLFYNTEGTGFYREKDPVYLSLVAGSREATGRYRAYGQYTALTSYFESLSWNWTAINGDYYGNQPLPNNGDWWGTPSSNSYSFLGKLVAAGLHDAAGNPLNITYKTGGTDITVPATEDYIANPKADMLRGDVSFTNDDTNHVPLSDTYGGPFAQARFIIDANKPTYSKTSNGIQPVILTKVVLNDKDVLQFQVNFSESTVLRRYDKDGASTGWQTGETYLEFNNGMKAYYKSGAGTKQWVFETTVPAGTQVETDGLEITKLANDAHTDDTYVLTDYVGNPMIEEAVTASIAWAELKVDNTDPTLDFDYSDDTGSGNDTTYGKTAAVTVNAADPASNEASGSGIFAPSNVNSGGDTAPSGLVYYVWAQGETERDAAINALSANNYALVKKYSLSAEQPEGYKGADVGALLVANNLTAIEAPDNLSGEYHLVAFTADMTWDSARQLIQYNKLKSFKTTEETAKTYFLWMLRALNIEGYASTLTDAELATAGEALDAEDVGGFTALDTAPDDWSTSFTNYYKYVNGNYVAFKSKDDDSTAYAITGDIASALAAKINDVATKCEFADRLTKADTFVKLVAAMQPYAAFNDAEYRADQLGMAESGAYEKWSDNDYTADDSNWVSGSAKVLLDNTAPVIVSVTPNDDGTAGVSVSVSVSDADSGVEKLEYAITAKGAGMTETTPWLPAELSGSNATLSTATLEDGEYDVYVRVTDNVGTAATSEQPKTIKKDSNTVINHELSAPPADGEYLTAIPAGLTVKFSGSVLGAGIFTKSFTLTYSFTTSSETPATWTSATGADAGTLNGLAAKSYAIAAPTDAASGDLYLHLKYTYAGLATPGAIQYVYKIDSTAPGVAFSPDGIGYGQETVTTTVTLHDEHSGVKDGSAKYMWLASDAAAPIAAANGWTSLPATRAVTTDAASLGVAAGESATYKLWVMVEDALGNQAIESSGTFTIEAPQSYAPPEVGGELASLTLAGDEYTAVVELTLDESAESQISGGKTGYGYSVAVVTGSEAPKWSRWTAYESFINVKLGDSLADKTILVKFRSPSGDITAEEEWLRFSELAAKEGAVWATAARDKQKMLKGGDDPDSMTLTLTMPEGVSVESAKNLVGNVTVASSATNAYTISGNGYYEFVLQKDGAEPESLKVCVSNFDSVPPAGTITYSEMVLTNANVTATLTASEDIKVSSVVFTPDDSTKSPVTDVSGGTAYVFTENGSAVFTFADEAGNESTAIAVVSWIDKTPPEAEIAQSYGYVNNGRSYTFNQAGALRGGVVLTVSSSTDSDFTVVSGGDTFGGKTAVVTENGDYTFVIRDRAGNTAGVTETVTGIVNTMPTPTATVNIVNDGTRNVARVTVSGTVDAQFGSSSVVCEGYGVSEITGLQHAATAGSYSFTKTYTSNGAYTAAVCDALGNAAEYSFEISGIDNAPPTISFDGLMWIDQGTTETIDSAWLRTKGGYTVSDDASAAGDIVVTLESSTVNKAVPGGYTVTYRATDAVGNYTDKTRSVYVIPTDGLLVTGDNVLFYSKSKDAALLKDNSIEFNISRYELMAFAAGGGAGAWTYETVTNDWATYDIYIQKGLYREGQLKYIQTVKLKGQNEATVTISPEQLTSGGWYTIIVRNSEREREYTTFFISSVQGS